MRFSDIHMALDKTNVSIQPIVLINIGMISSFTLVTLRILILTNFLQLLGFLGSWLLSGQNLFPLNRQFSQQHIVSVYLKSMGVFIQFFMFPPYLNTTGLHLYAHLLSFQQLIVFSVNMKFRTSKLSMSIVGTLNTL